MEKCPEKTIIIWTFGMDYIIILMLIIFWLDIFRPATFKRERW